MKVLLTKNTQDRITNWQRKLRRAVQKGKQVGRDQSGQLLVDHAGFVAVILVLIGLLLYLSYPWLRDTVWPAIQSKIMNLINYSG